MALLPFVDVKPAGQADAAVIWLHGLGDSGDGFAPIVPELRLPKSSGIRLFIPSCTCASYHYQRRYADARLVRY